MAQDIKKIEAEVSTLKDAVGKLGNAKHADRMLVMIHRPGWTTKREEELVRAHTRSLHRQVAHLHQSLDALMTIADKIGK